MRDLPSFQMPCRRPRPSDANTAARKSPPNKGLRHPQVATRFSTDWSRPLCGSTNQRVDYRSRPLVKDEAQFREEMAPSLGKR